MSFNPIAAIEVSQLLKDLPENPCVIELGNQTFTVTDEILESVISVLEKTGRTINLSALKSFRKKSLEEKKPLTEFFYKALGFTSYYSIDVNASYGSLLMDLNEDLVEKYQFKQTFDLVTNNGTGEHIFNQFLVFKNMHNLTKVGGVMLHIMPFVNWFNHCFYNFHPRLYADLAVANNYRIVRMGLANRWGTEININTSDSDSAYAEILPQPISRPSALSSVITAAKRSKLAGSLKPVVKPLLINCMAPQLSLQQAVQQLTPSPEARFSHLAIALMRLIRDEQKRVRSGFPVAGNVQIVAALQKIEDKPFRVPMQSMYVNDISSDEISKHYPIQTCH